MPRLGVTNGQTFGCNLWIDFSRTRSPRSIKTFIAPYILDAQACLAEPVVFEVLRHATDAEARQLMEHFQTLPLLASPPDLWSRGVALGQACRKSGFNAGSLDLLIAAVAVYHRAELITCDVDFPKIAAVSELRVKLLKRPS